MNTVITKISKFKPNVLALLVAVVTAIMALFSVPLCVRADAPVESHHYLAFNSDMHGETDKMTSSIKGFPQAPEYMSIIGDLVGEGGGSTPAYNAGEALSKITEVYSNITAENQNMSIIWADHDENVSDDNLGVVKCRGGNVSEEIYAKTNSDGSAAYYIYCIGFYNMLNGGSASSQSAAAFKAWVSTKDPKVPVLVLCHAPLLAKRGDNYGATYWNEALNYAATGVEGITGTDSSHSIIRNVIYMCGHNHTVDKTEYFYQAGSTMSIQIDKNASSELLTGGRSKAQGETSSIYYTAFFPGYITSNSTATFMDISDTAITLTKYKDGSAVSLGTDGVTGAAMPSSFAIARV